MNILPEAPDPKRERKTICTNRPNKHAGPCGTTIRFRASKLIHPELPVRCPNCGGVVLLKPERK